MSRRPVAKKGVSTHSVANNCFIDIEKGKKEPNHPRGNL
jgi:hypothetical protein